MTDAQHVPFTDNETNEGKVQRRALWKKVFDNDADREFRIDGQEGKSSDLLADHFDWSTEPIGGGGVSVHSSKWSIATEGLASVAILPGEHACRVRAFTSTHLRARLRGNVKIQPTLLPRMKVRTKFNHNVNPIGDFYWGFQSDRPLTTVQGSDFVALHRTESFSGLKFEVRKNGGAVTEGNVDIATPVLDTYFTFEIRYIDTDTVQCFFDGALIETFHGPGDTVPDGAGDQMFPDFHDSLASAPPQTQDMFIDKVEIRNTLIADSA